MTDSAQTFPRAQRVALGYSPQEDRLLVRLTLADGGCCAAWLSRRILSQLIKRLNEALRRSHPAADEAPVHDTVLALEHLAARSEIAGERRAGEDREDAESEAAEGGDQASDSSGDPEPQGSFLVTEARVEGREDAVLIGLAGHALPAEPGRAAAAEPVAGLSLTRAQAHELLHMLAEQAQHAQWGLSRSLSWLERLRRGGWGAGAGRRDRSR